MKVMSKFLLTIGTSLYLLSSPVGAMQPDNESSSAVPAKKLTSTPLKANELQNGMSASQNRSSLPVDNDKASGQDSKTDAPVSDERSLCLPGHVASPLAHTVSALNGPRHDQDNTSVIVYKKGWNTLPSALLKMIFEGTDILDHLAFRGICKDWRDRAEDRVYLIERLCKIRGTFLSRQTHYILKRFAFPKNSEILPLRQLLGKLLFVDSERLRANAREEDDLHLKTAKKTLDAACDFGEPVAHQLRVDYMSGGLWGYQLGPDKSRRLTEQLADQGQRWAMVRILKGYMEGEDCWPHSPAHAADANDRFAERGDERAFIDMIKGLFDGSDMYHENPREAYKRLLELDTIYSKVPKSERIQKF